MTELFRELLYVGYSCFELIYIYIGRKPFFSATAIINVFITQPKVRGNNTNSLQKTSQKDFYIYIEMLWQLDHCITKDNS